MRHKALDLDIFFIKGPHEIQLPLPRNAFTLRVCNGLAISAVSHAIQLLGEVSAGPH